MCLVLWLVVLGRRCKLCAVALEERKDEEEKEYKKEHVRGSDRL